MIVRPAIVVNPSATVSLTNAVVDPGTDRTVRLVKRILSAGDIGNSTGKTRHVDGCLFASFQGASIQDVILMLPFQPIAGNWLQMWNRNYIGVNFNTPAAIAWRISNDGYSLYVLDGASGSTTGAHRLAIGDTLYGLILLGN